MMNSLYRNTRAASRALLAGALLTSCAVSLHRSPAAYQSSCEGGDAVDCYSLGVLHDNGLGVAPDPEAAASYYQKACDAGYDAGCLSAAAVLGSASPAPVETTYSALKKNSWTVPPYPSEAKAEGLSGTCWIWLWVDEAGATYRVLLDADDACPAVFHPPIVETALTWTFYPFVVDGAPSKATLKYPVKFKLSG